MIKLLSLSFNNIGRFTITQEFDFNSDDKLILVDGPSGSGKSTIFNALDYLLGISLVPATQLQCRYTTKPIIVTGIFDMDGQIVEITRNKKDGLSIKIGEQLFEGLNDIVEEKLDQLLGIPRKLFKRMIHKPQKEGGFFLSLTAKQSFEFLIEVLGLKPYQDKIDKIAENVKKYEEEKVTINAKLQLVAYSVDEIQRVIDEQEPAKEITEEMIRTVEADLAMLREDLRASTEKHTLEMGKIEKPLKQAPTYDKTALNALILNKSVLENEKKTLFNTFTQQRSKYQDILSQFNQTLRSIDSYKEKYSGNTTIFNKIQADLKELQENSNCPTCKQQWLHISAQDHLDSLELKKNVLLQEQNLLEEHIKAEEDIVTKKQRMAKILADMVAPDTSEIDAGLQELQNEITEETFKQQNEAQIIENDFLTRYNAFLTVSGEIEQANMPHIRQLEKSIAFFSQDIENKKRQYVAEKTTLERFYQNKKKVADSLNEKALTKAALVQHMALIVHQIDIAEETKRLIRSYILQIFQETLNDIGETASQIIGNIHNMSNSSIYFEGCKETKSGTIKDEITAIINKNGENDIPIKTLSGGERSVVDLAVDLALIDVIESKTGKGANFFILDEPFTGLDEQSKEECMEILKEINSNKKLIVVDHSPELKEMIPCVINVSK